MNDEYQKQFDRFRADVASHVVTVLRDDGLYRHLRCSRGSYTCSFDVIAWPGYLCYTGDMGCFVFTRISDMFEFFRGRRTALIDRGYLAEKAVSADKHAGIKQYSEELFKAAVKADFESFVEDSALAGSEQASELWLRIEDDVLSCGDNQSDAITAAMNTTWAGRDVFPDFWEHRLEDYTCRFWWCCYAIPWAIEQYDTMRQVLECATCELEGKAQHP